MQLVIEIPIDAYNDLMKYGYRNLGSFDCGNILKAVTRGKVVPKGHGRLIDMKKLQKFVSDYTEYDAVQLILADRKDYLPTVIEADKESEG